MTLESLYTHIRGRYDKQSGILYMSAFKTGIKDQLCGYSNVVRGIKYDDACKSCISRKHGVECESNKLIKRRHLFFMT